MYVYLFLFHFNMRKNGSFFFLIPQDKAKVHLSGRKLEPRANTGRTWHSERKAPNLARNHKPATSCFGATQKKPIPRATIKEHKKKKTQTQTTTTTKWTHADICLENKNGLIKTQLGNEFTFSEYLTLPQNLIVWSRAQLSGDYRSIFTPTETFFGVPWSEFVNKNAPPSALIMSV